MTAVFLVSSFVLAVLFLNERDASNKAVEAKERAIKNYRASERWFVAALSLATNEEEVVDRLKEIEKVEKRKWDKEWHSESNTKLSIDDQRYADISMIGHLLKMHSNKQA